MFASRIRMRFHRLPWTILAAAASLSLPARSANAQATSVAVSPVPAAALAGLARCAAFADQRESTNAQQVGKQAEALYSATMRQHPRNPDVLVGLARVRSQCLVPNAELAQQGELTGSAIELLQTALEIAPMHWAARFVLANIYLRSPAFLRRAPLAAQEFDRLLAMQGDQTDEPLYARVFELRGLMHSRAGAMDTAAALWRRGSQLFPADSALRALSERAATTRSPLIESSVSARSGEKGVESSAHAAGAPSAGVPVATAATAPASLTTMQVVAALGRPGAVAITEHVIARSAILMTAGGTADVFQSVQTQPGATRISEGSDIYTRGGQARETALFVDGSRLLSLARFEGLSGGLFGALDPAVVRSVRYTSGAFSVKHGNALSGVIEIETDGRPRERLLRGGASLTQLAGTAHVPLTRRLGGWVTARATNTGLLLVTHGRQAEFSGSPHSEELMASVIASPSSTSEVRASVMLEQDDARRVVRAAGWNGPFHGAGAARSLLVSGRWMPGNGAVVLRHTLSLSARRSASDFGVLARTRDERTVSSRSDLEWAPRLDLTLRAGMEYEHLARADAGRIPTSNDVSPTAPHRTLVAVTEVATHAGVYVEGQGTRSRYTVVAGVRVDRLPGEQTETLDPRLAVAAQLGTWTARVGVGRFHQGRWQLAPMIPDAGVPSGIPRSADHVVVGLERPGSTPLQIEAFVKRYADFRATGAGPQVTASVARGVDLTARRALRQGTSAWTTYSLLDAHARLADGRVVRSPVDVTHSLTSGLTTAITPAWSLGITGRYGTGAPLTPIVGTERMDEGRIAPRFGTPMSGRLPAYARVDARLMRFAQTRGMLVTSFAEVLNLANRANASAVTYDEAFHSKQYTTTFFGQRTVVVGIDLQRR